MKIKNVSIALALTIAWCLAGLPLSSAHAQALHVDSVTVDSVWNTDSSWTSGGVSQTRQSRDCKISFIPQGAGAAMASVSMSVDGGNTFSFTTADSLKVKGYTLYSPLAIGQKVQITVRVLGGDRPGAVFKVTARQEAPVIAGDPQTKILGLTGTLTAGADIQAVLKVRLAGDPTSLGYSTIAKVYWDLLGDGTINDSTSGATAKSFTWQTKVPSGATVQTSKVIAVATDGNGLTSAPETLAVQFGLHRQIVMKNIPVGSFQMGEAQISDTVHQVTLSAFSMQETPVTQEQFLAVMDTNPSKSLGDLARPVEEVTWYDAVLYCNALSKLFGLDTCYSHSDPAATDAVCDFTKKGYRLPTEAEWEYACRGGTTTIYWWGNDSNGLGARVFTPPYGAQSSTTTVASLLPNGYGLYDVDGNGWKWCNDWYHQPYASASATNPKGPATGVTRVLRGGVDLGSFFQLQNFYRSAYRYNFNPVSTNEYTGFCCARSL